MNYETRAVSLWLSNDEGAYHYWREVASEYAGEEDNDCDGETQDDIDGLADRLESELGELPENLNDIQRDMLNHSFASVDWKELAQDLLDE
jgi:hypothetical protein